MRRDILSCWDIPERRGFGELDWQKFFIIHSVLLIPVSACWCFNRKISRPHLQFFKHWFWFSNGTVHLLILLKLSQQCVQEHFYTADISNFSIGGQVDAFFFLFFCMVVSVDPKTVILISDVFSVFCFGSHEESKRCMFESVTVTGKRVKCFCFFTYMTLWHITLLEKERLNRGSCFCKYMTHYSYLSLAV